MATIPFKNMVFEIIQTKVRPNWRQANKIFSFTFLPSLLLLQSYHALLTTQGMYTDVFQ
jgi:hypothetical protein